MAAGWIKMYRQFTEWEWYKDIPVRILFEHCLFKANREEKKWQGTVIKQGSFITSYENLAFETGLSVRQVRTALNKLKSTGELTHKTTSRYSIITVNNWEKYQASDTQNDNQMTSKRQTNDKQATTTKEIEEIKKEKNIISLCEKKLDPFINPIKTFFLEECQRILKKVPRLSSYECNRLVELAADNSDIRELIPVAIGKLKGIKFNDINFKPSVNWLLKGNNFERVINGEFDIEEEQNDDAIFERLREKWEKK